MKFFNLTLFTFLTVVLCTVEAKVLPTKKVYSPKRICMNYSKSQPVATIPMSVGAGTGAGIAGKLILKTRLQYVSRMQVLRIMG